MLHLHAIREPRVEAREAEAVAHVGDGRVDDHVVVRATVVAQPQRRARLALGRRCERVHGRPRVAAHVKDVHGPVVNLRDRLDLEVVAEDAVAPLAPQVRVEVLGHVLRKVVTLLLHVIEAQPAHDVVHLGVAVHAVRDGAEEAVAIIEHPADVQAARAKTLLEAPLQLRVLRCGDGLLVELIVRVDRLIVCAWARRCARGGGPGLVADVLRRVLVQRVDGCGSYDAFIDSTLLHDSHGTFVHAHLLCGLGKEAVPIHGR